MSTLKGLFIDFEYAPRAHVVAVPFAVVGVQPGASHHSIFEELWHLTKWQTFVLQMARGEAVRSDFQEDDFLEVQAPEDEAAWQALVGEFLEGSEAAATLAGDEDALAVQLPDGVTVRERLEPVPKPIRTEPDRFRR